MPIGDDQDSRRPRLIRDTYRKKDPKIGLSLAGGPAASFFIPMNLPHRCGVFIWISVKRISPSLSFSPFSRRRQPREFVTPESFGSVASRL